LSYDT
jgi:hypothetical protein